DHLEAHGTAAREGHSGHRARLLHERGRGEGVLHRRPRPRAPLSSGARRPPSGRGAGEATASRRRPADADGRGTRSRRLAADRAPANLAAVAAALTAELALRAEEA